MKQFLTTRLFVMVLFAGISSTATAQTKFAPVDKSPLDMSYYPNSYPVLKIQDKVTEPVMARVIYSRPQKNGRIIFGELVEYGKLWRLGANEATEIEFYQPVKLGKTRVKKGRYTLYCIPYADRWTLILNRDTDTWGAFKYNQTMDVARMDIPVQRMQEIQEFYSMQFEKSTAGFSLVIGWDDVKVAVPFSL